MAIPEILDTIFGVASKINTAYEMFKNVQDFFNNPTDAIRRELDDLYYDVFKFREESAAAYTAILNAIDALKVAEFRSHMADLIAHAETAWDDVDVWRTTGGPILTIVNEADFPIHALLEDSRTNAYPDLSLMLPIAQILPMYLMVLKQVFPQFMTSQGFRTNIENSIKLMSATVDGLEAQILSFNQINDNTFVNREMRIIPPSEGGGREKVTVIHVDVSYRNISGTASYLNGSSDEIAGWLVSQAQVDEIVAPVRKAAAAKQATGLAEDLLRAQIDTVRKVVDTAQTILNGEETKLLSQKIFGRDLTEVERAEFATLRQSVDLRQSTMQAIDKFFTEEKDGPVNERETIKAYGVELLDRELTDPEEQALTGLAQTFGIKAALNTLLTHSDSVFGDHAGAMSPDTGK